MGIWQWIAETPDVNHDELKALALLGLHWMITPYRELTLVHAVQQPLKVPILNGSSIADKEADKNLEETFGQLDCWIKLDAKSTSKFDLLARWDDPVDPLNKAGWEILQGHAHVFESQVPIDQDDFRFGFIENSMRNAGCGFAKSRLTLAKPISPSSGWRWHAFNHTPFLTRTSHELYSRILPRWFPTALSPSRANRGFQSHSTRRFMS